MDFGSSSISGPIFAGGVNLGASGSITADAFVEFVENELARDLADARTDFESTVSFEEQNYPIGASRDEAIQTQIDIYDAKVRGLVFQSTALVNGVDLGLTTTGQRTLVEVLIERGLLPSGFDLSGGDGVDQLDGQGSFFLDILGTALTTAQDFVQDLGVALGDLFDGDGQVNGISVNTPSDYFGDRDGDGIINILDTDDGVGANDVQNQPSTPGGSSGDSTSYGGGTDSYSNDVNDDGSYRPIILDLDGDGVEISAGAAVYFDVDNDGFLEQTSWAAADDGFLVLDLNADGTRGAGDGVIDQADELVLSNWGEDGDTDLQALGRAFDDNNDGVIDAQDAVWSELRVWQDLDQDGETDDGELRTLSDWGITSINVTYDDGSAFDNTENDITVFGNTLHGLASYTTVDDQGVETVVTGGVGDVALAYNTQGWRRQPLLMPLRGNGLNTARRPKWNLVYITHILQLKRPSWFLHRSQASRQEGVNPNMSPQNISCYIRMPSDRCLVSL